MNGNDIMKAMNNIDERYISEAAAETKISEKRGGLSRHAARVAIGIAAAMAFAVPAGAYAYKEFIHYDNVEHYIKSADELESRGLVINEHTEDDELRFTVDTLLCDGKQAYGVLTAERVGEKAGQELDILSYSATIVYADTGEFITNNWCRGAHYDGSEKPGQNRQEILIDISDVDTSRGIKMLFQKRTPKGNKYGDGKLTGQVDDSNIPIRYDYELPISFETNVDVTKLYDSDGNEITLSEFEIYSDTMMWNILVDRDGVAYITPPDKHLEDLETSSFGTLKFIDKNGKKHEMNFYGAGSMEDYSYIYFDELINVDEISGVDLGGVEFFRAE